MLLFMKKNYDQFEGHDTPKKVVTSPPHQPLIYHPPLKYLIKYVSGKCQSILICITKSAYELSLGMTEFIVLCSL